MCVPSGYAAGGVLGLFVTIQSVQEFQFVSYHKLSSTIFGGKALRLERDLDHKLASTVNWSLSL